MTDEGDYHCPSSKTVNLFDELHMNKDQYADFLHLFETKVSSWKQYEKRIEI